MRDIHGVPIRRPRAVGGIFVAMRAEAGFGLLGTVISLMVLALLSVGALKAFAGGAGAGSGAQALGASVTKAYDIEAQSNLSTAVQNARDGAITNGGLSGLDLTAYGVTAGPSSSPDEVSGAEANSSNTSSDFGSSLGSGSVTLAAKSKSGTCWFAWFAASATWFGAEPDATSCGAQPMAAAPTPGPASPGTIGWQLGSFPITR